MRGSDWLKLQGGLVPPETLYDIPGAAYRVRTHRGPRPFMGIQRGRQRFPSVKAGGQNTALDWPTKVSSVKAG